MTTAIKKDVWMGYAIKTGGTCIVSGFEGADGTIFNLSDTYKKQGFQLFNGRVGLGLGAGGNACLVFLFNSTNPVKDLGKKLITDWGVNISLGGNLSAAAKTIVKAVKNRKLLSAAAKIAKSNSKFTKTELSDMRDAAHTVYNTIDAVSENKKPKLVLLDIPIGAGLEVSLHATFGYINFYHTRF